MKKPSIKNPIIRLLIVIVSVAILFFGFNATKIASDISDFGFGFFGSLRYTFIEYPIKKSSNFFKDFAQFLIDRDKERILKAEIEMLELYKSELEEAYRQINELKGLNGLNLSASEFHQVATTVIYRPSDVFLSTLVIDKGSKDGILKDAALVTNRGLVGKVETVYENRSIVRLLTTQTQKNKVALKIQVSPSTTAEAILEHYNPQKQVFEVILLDTNISINPGNSVITSGLGGVFPSGLLVGQVSEVMEMPNTLGAKILVKPSANFYNFNYALVVYRISDALEEIEP